MPGTLTVALLFTDLVDSTRLSSRLAPGEADALRKVHFGLLRAALEHGDGREVKNMGDGIMVVAPSPSAGVAIAVAMQQAIERHNRTAPVQLAVRIGLAAGEVTADDGDYFGDPVVEAARLCALADGGQILATDTVRVLAGRRSPHRFEVVGERELKGLPDPVTVVEVGWEPLTPVQAGHGTEIFPSRLDEVDSGVVAFTGRAQELDVLAQAYKEAGTEARLRLVFVGGEPGIGKTVLAARAARAASAAGAMVLYGACDESLGVAYHPWVPVLAGLSESVPDEALERLSDVHRGALARLLGHRSLRLAVGAPERQADTSMERLILVEAVAALLSVGSTSPLVVVVDDLQWADAATVGLLRHLVTCDDAMRVLVIGTYRPADIGHRHPLAGLLGDLRRERRGARVDLAGLTAAEVASMMEAAAAQDLGPGAARLAEALVRETDGNPFFVAELLRHLSESDAVVQDSVGRYALRAALDEIGLPGSIREVICHRVARLGEDAERVLGLAAVAGQGFDLDMLTVLAAHDADDVLDVLDAGRAAGLLVEDRATGHWSFAHSLIQHTLYQELGPSRRQRTHQRLGEYLEARRANAAELARHWLAATRPADGEKALRYVVAAGDEARDALSPEDAVAWYRQALDLLDQSPNADLSARGRLLVAIGLEQWKAGDPQSREALLGAAEIGRQTGDRDVLVGAALARGVSGMSQAPADSEFLALIEDALGAVGSGDSATRARLLVALSNELDPREWRRRTALRTDARQMAQRLADEPTLLQVLAGSEVDSGTDPAEGLAELAYELAQRLGDVSSRFQAVHSLLVTSGVVADIDAVDRLLGELRGIAEASKLAQHRYVADWMSAWREMLAGRLDRAESYAASSYEAGLKARDPSALPSFAVQMSQIRGQQGRGAEVVALYQDAVATLPSISAMRPVLSSFPGAEDEGVALLDHDTANRFADYPPDITWAGAMCQSARAAVYHRHRGAALVLTELLMPHEGRLAFIGSIDYGAFDLTLGRLARVLGRLAEAERMLRQALAIHERINAPYWTASTQIELGRHLGGAEARSLAAAALETARAHGYQPLERRAAQLLR